MAGIPYFYRQFGYEYSVELDHFATIPVRQLPGKSRVSYRSFKESDIPEAMKLFEESQKSYFVEQKRTQAIWDMQQSTNFYNGEPFDSYTLTDEEGMIAYIRVKDDKDIKNIL